MRERARHAQWMAAVAVLVGLAASGASAAVTAVVPSLELPVRDVTVFSDRARVTRAAEVRLEPGERRVRLPYLPPALEPGSVRLEATGAKVVRLEVMAAESEEFPRGEAAALLKTLERLADELQALRDEQEPLTRERAMLLGLRPTATPTPEPKGAPVPLDPTGWKASLAFLEARETAIAEALAPIEARMGAKLRELEVASERAQQLAAEATGRPGHRVEAVLDGKGGAATLALRYVARGARWYPAYDVRSQSGESSVELELGALVSQETGEDWLDARLVLSTAVPASTPTLPKLAVWKIGDQERFIPTPRAGPVPWKPAPPPVPVPEPRPPLDEPLAERDEALRERLLAAVSQAQRPREAPRRELAEKRGVPHPSAAAPRRSPSAPPPMAMARRSEEREFAVAAPSMAADSVSNSEMSRGASPPVQALPFGAPPGWKMPDFAADLPVALAGGYDFTYAAVRPESVRAGEGPRRVALGSRRLPASTLVQVFPALRKDAFVVAELTNTTDRPLLKGRANLFVGGDLQGTSELPTTALGARLPLSLGVDDAISVERSVRVLESERGLISRQDVATYEVVIELLNSRSRPVQARVRDQVPLSADKSNVEITFEKADFGARPDPASGVLEWTLELSPGVKRTVGFRYTFARPRGWRPTETFAPLEGK